MSQDEFLLAEHGDGKQHSLCMLAVPQDEIDYLCNGAGLIQGTVNVVYWNGGRQLLCTEPVTLNIMSIDKLPGGSRVDKGLEGFYLSGVRRLNLNL